MSKIFMYDQPTMDDFEDWATWFVREKTFPVEPYDPFFRAIIDNRIHRIRMNDNHRDEPCSYKFKLTGNGCVGWVLYFRTMDSAASDKFPFDEWNRTHTPIELTGEAAEEQAKRKEQLRIEREKQLKEQEEKQRAAYDEAAEFARAQYLNSPQLAWHTYLIKKQVPCVEGMRFGYYDTYHNYEKYTFESVIVPLFNSKAEIRTLQFIYWDFKEGKFQKRYFKDAERKNTFVCITANGLEPLPKKLPENTMIGIAEGLATALTCYEALKAIKPNVLMITAMDANTLKFVGKLARRRFKKADIYFFADNDSGTFKKGLDNKGLKESLIANATIKNPKNHVIVPALPERNDTNVDWNDIACTYGMELVKRIFLLKLKESEE